MATVVVACLFVAFVAVASVLASLHNPTTPSAGAPTASTLQVSSSAGSRLRAATSAADAAASTTRSRLHEITGIPTPKKVIALINPYVASLEHYDTVLGTTSLPPGAAATVTGISAQVSENVQFLSTINGLPSLQLGSYLEQFGKSTARLQTTLRHLEADLGSSTS